MAEGTGQTLTFLFTDLEGSTRLWEDHPAAMRTALAHHDQLMRGAVEGNRGQLVKSTGDGAMAAFRSAADGISAAIGAQQALAAADWPSGVDLRVRMGLHGGEATERDGDWFGSGVNRAARVMAVAHGGQVVCSRVVADQVMDRVDLLDLGEHRLRDLQSPVHLFQVHVPGLSASFPPLRSLDAYRSNLPHELSSFVGRQTELGTIVDRTGDARIVSIVGVGGVGKTRLALQAGSDLLHHFADGVWLCELAHVLVPDDLVPAVAAAVSYTPPQGVSVADGLPRFLERKDLLLVLDNCEHLVEAVADWVTATTSTAAAVSVLVTSREALGVRGEHIVALASLGIPGDAEAASLRSSDAGALFVARAEEARGSLILDEGTAHAVRELCIRLDGIPLALELAAAQTRVMTPAEILARLDKQFRLVTGGRSSRLERHQTLRAAIDWSYDLLTDDQRAMLGRLSVFVGGFDLDAATALAVEFGVDEFDAMDLLAELVGKSLVERTERDGSTRYRMLEMIRQYAFEKLNAAGDAVAARDDHARWFLADVVELFRQTRGTEDYAALAAIEQETPNLVAAGRWLLAEDRIAELLGFFESLVYLDPFSWPITTCDDLGALAFEAIGRPDSATYPGFDPACCIAGYRAFMGGDSAGYARVAELLEQVGSERSATAIVTQATELSYAEGDAARWRAMLGAAVDRARIGGDPVELSWTLGYHASAVALDEPSRGLELAEEAVAIARSVGGPVALLFPMLALANSLRSFDGERALVLADEVGRLDRTRRQTYVDLSRGSAANLHLDRGEIAEGLQDFRQSFHSWVHRGDRSVLALSLGALASTLAEVEPDAAIELGAVNEGGALVHLASFSLSPQLRELRRRRPADVEAVLARCAGLSHDEAVAHVGALIDRLIVEHGGVPDPVG